MSCSEAPQATTIKNTIIYHRKTILQSERALLDNPSEENFAALKRALEDSRRWRESIG